MESTSQQVDLPDLIDHFAQVHGVSRETAKTAALASGYGATRETVQAILDGEDH